MKIRFAFILLTIVVVACHSHHTDQDVKLVKIKIDSSTNKEYLDWSTVKINGVIPMISSFKEVVKQLGTPDKIDTLAEGVNGSYYNRKFQYCYFKGITFEKYNDTLVYCDIDFRKPGNWYLLYKQIRFDRGTTWDEFEKLFPMSAKENQLHGSDMDKFLAVSVRTAKPSSSIRYNWVFTFEQSDNKLIRLEYWIAN